jgi:hypothetical protein
MRKLPVLVAALVLAAGLTTHARPHSTQTPAPKPPAKTSVKAPADITGKWNMSLETQQGTMTNVLDLKLDGKKVTGTLTSQRGEQTVAGEYVDGKLTFALSYESQNGTMQIGFAATVKDDGTLVGTLTAGEMEVPWKAERVKDKDK